MRGGIVTPGDLPRVRQCLIEVKADGELRLQTVGEYLRKLPQTVQYMIGGGVTQSAMRLVLHDLAELPQFFKIVW